MTITIMQVVHDLNYGGMQRVVVDLCLKTDPSRFTMMVCCLNELGPNADVLLNNNIPVHLVKKKPGIDLSLPVRLRKLFAQENVRLVHTHGINPFFYGSMGAILAGSRVVQTDHNRGPLPVKKSEMYSEMVLSWFSSKVVAVSEGVRADLIRYEHMAPEKTMVIYNGIDCAAYDVAIDSVKKRNELGIQADDFVVGITCRITRQKGIPELIEAVAKVAKQHPNIKLVVVGDGEPRAEYERFAVLQGVQDKVLFTGYRQDIPELVQLFDVYALPSYNEGHPIVLLEAMAARKPIVATDIAGIRETVDHGKTGLLVPVGKSHELAGALARLKESPELRNAMATAGHQKFIECFTMTKAIQQYANLYEQVSCVG